MAILAAGGGVALWTVAIVLGVAAVVGPADLVPVPGVSSSADDGDTTKPALRRRRLFVPVLVVGAVSVLALPAVAHAIGPIGQPSPCDPVGPSATSDYETDGNGTPVSRGDSVTVSADPGETVRVVREDGEETLTVGVFEVPAESRLPWDGRLPDDPRNAPFMSLTGIHRRTTMPNSKGPRHGTREKLSNDPRERGTSPPQRSIEEFENGQTVHLRLDPSVPKGQFHPRYDGHTGEVIEPQGGAYKVRIDDQGKEKLLIAAPAHLTPQEQE